MKQYLVIILLLLCTTIMASELSEFDKKSDSLTLRLKQAKGTNRVDILYELIKLHAPWEQEQAEKYIDEEWILANELDYRLGIGKVYQNKGDLEFYRDNYSKAIDYYNMAIDVFLEHDYYKELGWSYLKIALVFINTGNWKRGIDIIPKGIKAFEKGKNYGDLAAVYWVMGFFNSNFFHDYKKSKELLYTALDLAESQHLPDRIYGGILASLSLAYSLDGENDTAIIISKKVLEYFDDNIINERVMKTQCLWELGNRYKMKGDNDSAMFYYSTALVRAEEMTYNYGIIYISQNMAMFYYDLKDYTNAIKYDKQAIEKALIVYTTGKSFQNEAYKRAPSYAWDWIIKIVTADALRQTSRGLLCSSCFMLSKSYEALGNTNEAFEYYKLYNAWFDTIIQSRREKELFGL